MLKAETRAAILGETLARANEVYPRGPRAPCDPSRMTDTEIEADYHALIEHAANITRQLDDDRDMMCSRGDAWRKRAMGARRFRLAEADRLLIEARKRRLGFATEMATGPIGLNGQPVQAPSQAVVDKQRARERQAAIEAEHRARKAAELAHKEEMRRLEIARAEAKAAEAREAARLKAERHAQFLQAGIDKRAAIEARARSQERLFVEAARDLLGNEACREIWRHAREMHPDPAIWGEPVA